jgi:hypothetical protein
MQGFLAVLPEINRLADSAPGLSGGIQVVSVISAVGSFSATI